jgi:hypothetical protein
MSTMPTQHADFKQLTDETRQLLLNRPVWMSFKRINEDTGLTTSWLNQFMNRPKFAPSAARLFTLYEYLSKRTVKITTT